MASIPQAKELSMSKKLTTNAGERALGLTLEAAAEARQAEPA